MQYRKNCDFRVEDSERDLSARMMDLHEQFFTPTMDKHRQEQRPRSAVFYDEQEVLTGKRLWIIHILNPSTNRKHHNVQCIDSLLHLLQDHQVQHQHLIHVNNDNDVQVLAYVVHQQDPSKIPY